MVRSPTFVCSDTLPRPRHRGFTLLEALTASAILMGIVTAVTAAIIAGQQSALEARERIAGTLAAEALMGRILADDYNNLPTWNGFTEAAGEMLDEAGQPMPASFGTVGRDVTVTTTFQTLASLGVNIAGRTVRVRAFDMTGRTLIELERFIPEPQS